MKLAGILLAIVVLALVVPFFIPAGGPVEPVESSLPWQVEADGAGGSRVFGLQPGVSTLADVRQRFGRDIDLGILAAPGETGTLEGYYDNVALGFVTAKLVVTLDATPQAIASMRERAPDSEYMESANATRRMRLHADDLAAVERMPIRAIAVIPALSLDDAAVVQRFGEPAERVAVSETQTHLLYPGRGLDILVDAKRRELLQYVAPRDFDKLLRAPLKAHKPAAAG